MGLHIAYYDNDLGEPIETIGGVACNLNFWDCECQANYIHPVSETKCQRCGAEYENMPPAREDEVKQHRQ
jgi:hypothetical protein